MRPQPDFYISSDRRDFDFAWIVRAIRTSYWGSWQSGEAITLAINHSLNYGAFTRETRAQIGFIRAVTDHATFSSITDVIVTPEWQRKGVGTALMEKLLANPWMVPTICVLASRDARDFYSRFRFVSVGGDVMKRSPTPT